MIKRIVMASLLAAALLTLCATHRADASDALPNVFVFRSWPREAVVVYRTPDEITMVMDGRAYRMTQVVSASGAHYVTDDGQTSFWNKGSSAWVTLRGRDITGEFRLVRSYRTVGEFILRAAGEAFVMVRTPTDGGVRYEAAGDESTVFEADRRSASLTVRGAPHGRYELSSVSPFEDEIDLAVNGERFVLRRVPSADGARFEATSDPTTYFWCSGDRGVLVVRGEENIAYDASAATRDELYTAEPSIAPAQVDSQATEEAAPAMTEAQPTSYAPQPSAAPSRPSRTAGEFDAIPYGVEWKVVRVRGMATPSDAAVSLAFAHSATIAGQAHVNSYHAGFIAAQGRLIIEGPASTRMAGPTHLMEAEASFLATLTDVRSYAIYDDELALFDASGAEVITCTR